MTDYKQLYEAMKEKQTTTFAMLMKVMEKNEELNKRIKEDYKIIEFQEERINDLHIKIKLENDIKD